MAKKKDATEDRIEAVESALSKSEQFIESNQKIITYVIGALIVVVLVFFGYNKYIASPKEKAANEAIFQAELYFEQDSLNLALVGDGESYGFLDIIDDYSSTKAGNLAKYYAGIIYLNQGEYDNAIEYLKKFSGDDIIVSAMAIGATGDAYMQKGETDKAASYYMDAASTNSNELSSPAFLLKAGWAYEMLDKNADALKAYEKIKADFPRAREAREVEKYISRAKANLGEL